MDNKLFDYQENGITEISKLLSSNDSVLAVAPTGSGKAVILSTISQRYTIKSTKDVIIFVHRKELLEQTRKTLFEWYGIISQKIDAKTTSIQPDVRVFVAMVETFSIRSKTLSFLDNFKNIGLLIIDEAHLNSFTKIIIHFYAAKKIGFTATPISATKKDPLKNRYSVMYQIAEQEELIELNQQNPKVGIVHCDAYAPKSIDRNSVKRKGNDFDEDDMGEKYSKKEQIQNAIDTYVKLGYGKRTLIFNSNIKHSIKVYEAFKELGFNVRHFDSDKSGKFGGDAYREDCLKWLSETPDAILCNIGILTTGFDLKSIEFILINRMSTSLTLIWQIVGRGLRAFIFPNGRIKHSCVVGDLGGNFESLGINPNKNFNWYERFNNPQKPSEGISPIKLCPDCGAINSASARICLAKVYIPLLDIEGGECGYIFPVIESVEDLIPKEMVRLFQDKIDVKQAIEVFKDRHDWHAYDNVLNGIALLAKQEVGIELEKEQLEFIYETAYQKSKEYFRERKKHPYMNFRHGVMEEMDKRLAKNGFNLDLEMVSRIKDSYRKHNEAATI